MTSSPAVIYVLTRLIRYSFSSLYERHRTSLGLSPSISGNTAEVYSLLDPALILLCAIKSSASTTICFVLLNDFDSDFDVVMSGGIMLNYPEYAQAVTERASKRAHMIRANVPPILGSALDAVWNAKDEPAPDFRERFMDEYLILKASQGK